ncbi:MAG: hypothetical protein A2913_01530 [Parcubacteria group bacterium RIFCSPLOWO2_01_FULL_40_65]|nr:MAG: hypothetical protein A2734_02400 [Parcubacteria group bacterium RIFCSPHIGHO2_01_FULL_40_30]OHB18741.1 MAG: hypothetical protein A3D40_01865 [Parcubacteria group bacterium RIFCSPHIGHO2_02_FULL_40_12]OHB21832.1 MAG: hypothetical protein A2913_01530 [Parcubacteria group bacterium RIFCSPLOWO2_01_FULL_40_65]OHB22817.1 MAG: hypothetical protein A3I22_00520 [Parcubacteria group bacterium RIFCSPLOWO2_02_FULL_40_12]OHB24457.1 MAG: hypothetical protein A3F96_00440 [Parcubacteria group bacterium R
MNILLSILGNSLGLYFTQYSIENFAFSGGYQNYLTAGLVLAVLNFTLKPVIKFITAPIILMTLGLFIIAINALMLWITDYFFVFMDIGTMTALMLSTIIIGFINLVIGIIYKLVD